MLPVEDDDEEDDDDDEDYLEPMGPLVPTVGKCPVGETKRRFPRSSAFPPKRRRCQRRNGKKHGGFRRRRPRCCVCKPGLFRDPRTNRCIPRQYCLMK